MANHDYTAESKFLPSDVLTALGRVAAHWGYMETEFNMTVAGLVVHPDFEQERYLQIPFKSRLRLARRAAAKLYRPEHLKMINQIFDKIANARSARDTLMHGRVEVTEDGRSIFLETHHHTNRDGSWRVSRQPCSLRQINGAAQRILNATNSLVEFNRRLGRSSVGSWLDIDWKLDRAVIRRPPPTERIPLSQLQLPLE